MSRDDYDDDDRPRRRRRRRDRDEYDDYDEDVRRRPQASSGSVTSVGVISIILGSLMLLCGLCLTIFSLAASGQGPAFGGQMFPFQAAIWAIVAISIAILVLGVLYMVGGIGVLQRGNWGRIMTLVMAGFSGIGGILCLIAVIGVVAAPAMMEGKAIGVLIYLLGAGVYFTHCIMSFIVLLSSQNVAEFE